MVLLRIDGESNTPAPGGRKTMPRYSNRGNSNTCPKKNFLSCALCNGRYSVRFCGPEERRLALFLLSCSNAYSLIVKIPTLKQNENTAKKLLQKP